MMEKRPDTAMKDMSEMTKTMSELMKKDGGNDGEDGELNVRLPAGL